LSEITSVLALQTIEYLREFPFARHAMCAALCIATASAALSSIVVLKRLAFVGQGISHAAFGGIGLIAALGLSGLAGESVIFVFCLTSAMFVAGLSRARTREDTAIGIVLVGTMAIGFLLLGVRQHLLAHAWYREFIAGSPTPASWDTILFGSTMLAGRVGAWMSAVVMVIVLLSVWWWRRPLIAFVFDETAAEAAGVNARAMRMLLMVLLALVVVVGMKLVGVVLISALLVLPGAIAAHLSRSLVGTVATCWVAALIGVVGGLVVSFEFDLPTGPAIVLALIVQFAAAVAMGRMRN
jgi:zinc transport system permease protein